MVQQQVNVRTYRLYDDFGNNDRRFTGRHRTTTSINATSAWLTLASTARPGVCR